MILMEKLVAFLTRGDRFVGLQGEISEVLGWTCSGRTMVISCRRTDMNDSEYEMFVDVADRETSVELARS